MIELHRSEAGDLDGLIHVNADLLLSAQRFERDIADDRGDFTILTLAGGVVIKVEEPVDDILALIAQTKRPPDRAAS